MNIYLDSPLRFLNTDQSEFHGINLISKKDLINSIAIFRKIILIFKTWIHKDSLNNSNIAVETAFYSCCVFFVSWLTSHTSALFASVLGLAPTLPDFTLPSGTTFLVTQCRDFLLTALIFGQLWTVWVRNTSNHMIHHRHLKTHETTS